MTIPRPILALAFLSLITTSIAIVAVILSLISQSLVLAELPPTPTYVELVATPSLRPTSTEVPIVAQAATETSTPTATPTATDTFTPTATLIPSLTPSATLPPPPTSTFTAAPRVSASFGERCTSVVGDSVAHGEAVYEVPYTGYILARFATMAGYLKAQFQARGDNGMKVYSRTAPAVGISSGGYPSYFGTAEFAQLLQDKCAYTVIIPWINDLSGTDAAGHANALANLVGQVLASNPSGRVLVVNYYYGRPAPYALNFASGFTDDKVNSFNGAIAAQCNGGALARPNVICVDAASLFAGGTGHLSGPLGRDEFRNGLIAPMSAEEEGFFNSYFASNPNGQLTGDGVHLSAAGKTALAAHLMQWMR